MAYAMCVCDVMDLNKAYRWLVPPKKSLWNTIFQIASGLMGMGSIFYATTMPNAKHMKFLVGFAKCTLAKMWLPFGPAWVILHFQHDFKTKVKSGRVVCGIHQPIFYQEVRVQVYKNYVSGRFTYPHIIYPFWGKFICFKWRKMFRLKKN